MLTHYALKLNNEQQITHTNRPKAYELSKEHILNWKFTMNW